MYVPLQKGSGLIFSANSVFICPILSVAGTLTSRCRKGQARYLRMISMLSVAGNEEEKIRDGKMSLINNKIWGRRRSRIMGR